MFLIAIDGSPTPVHEPIMSSSLSPRAAAMRAISTRSGTAPNIPVSSENPIPASEYFGINTFGARQMRDKLPKDVYVKLVAAIRLGKKLDVEIAPPVDKANTDWAVARGVTDCCRWFTTPTGPTAQKQPDPWR